MEIISFLKVNLKCDNVRIRTRLGIYSVGEQQLYQLCKTFSPSLRLFTAIWLGCVLTISVTSSALDLP